MENSLPVQKNKWRKRIVWSAGLLAILILVGIVGYQALMRYFMDTYYRQNYAPIELKTYEIETYPPEHHLQDVPWIGAALQVCQSTSLQMIAAQHQIIQPRNYFDFLMGFTYGESNIEGEGFSPFGTDPETGFQTAAPYLGLARGYYVTNDQALYPKALRAYLSKGYPIRVALDMGALYGKKDFIAHSEVLVGYDLTGLYYYETVCLPPATCTPGEHPPGDPGIHVTDQQLLKAVASQSKNLQYPWRYAFSIFEPGQMQQDTALLWSRNGQSMGQSSQYGPKMGPAVIDDLAAKIEQQGARFDLSKIRSGIALAVVLRKDNATYLREAYPNKPDLENAAALFVQAAADYQAVQDAIQDGIADQAEADQIAARLHDAASAERKTGEIFIRYGDSRTTP